MSRYTLRYTSAARRGLGKLPPEVLHAVLTFCAGPLLDNPYRVGKELRGNLVGYHTARPGGTYRIMYQIFEDEVVVEVVRVGPRASIYRAP